MPLAVPAGEAQPIATTLDAVPYLGNETTVMLTDGAGHEFRGTVASVSAVELGMTGQHDGAGEWSDTLTHFVLMRDAEGRWRISSPHASTKNGPI